MERLIRETEAMDITVDKFGALLETAERVWKNTLDGLREKLLRLKQKRAQEEKDRQDAEIEAPYHAEVLNKTLETFESALTPPSAYEMVQVLADHYGVSERQIVTWITSHSPSEFTELKVS